MAEAEEEPTLLSLQHQIRDLSSTISLLATATSQANARIEQSIEELRQGGGERAGRSMSMSTGAGALGGEAPNGGANRIMSSFVNQLQKEAGTTRKSRTSYSEQDILQNEKFMAKHAASEIFGTNETQLACEAAARAARKPKNFVFHPGQGFRFYWVSAAAT